ncbi:MAG: GNAT family N-acetyltransferase [Candidatus Eremiobacteraeota bacterium]|nr:GNAT family N-acetyltransferase [Candidatus Eremiobacteraeota bacterium]
MVIRPLIESDIPHVRAIDALCFAPDDQYDQRTYDAMARSDESIVAIEGDVVVGYAFVQSGVANVDLRIRSLAVYPEYQRRGCGEALVQHILARTGSVDLLVDESNATAVGLYERLGFVRADISEIAPGKIRMVRTINSGTGPGARTLDGSSVELYKLLPERGESEIIHSALAGRARILELGSGVGRVTHRLVELGHPVTAVDFSREMLAQIKGAQTIFADIAELRLNRTFDGVVLGSTLINIPAASLRRKFLMTCKEHVSSRGRVIVECHAKTLLERAVPGLLHEENGIRISWLDVERKGDFVTGTLEYRLDDRRWTQTFSTQFLGEPQIRDALDEVGLEFCGWLNDQHTWFTACRGIQPRRDARQGR